MSWLRLRGNPESAPSVVEAVKLRDALFAEFELAMQKVDQVKDKVISDYSNEDRRRTMKSAK